MGARPSELELLAFPEALLSDSSNRDGQMERGEIVFDSSYNQDGY